MVQIVLTYEEYAQLLTALNQAEISFDELAKLGKKLGFETSAQIDENNAHKTNILKNDIIKNAKSVNKEVYNVLLLLL